jgi:hypothetical protein
MIAAITDHIQEIIRLEGGNECKEGVQGFKRSWAGTRLKGILSSLQFTNRKEKHHDQSGENSDDEPFVDPDWESSEEPQRSNLVLTYIQISMGARTASLRRQY